MKHASNLVSSEDMIDPPIHDGYFRASGATTEKLTIECTRHVYENRSPCVFKGLNLSMYEAKQVAMKPTL